MDQNRGCECRCTVLKTKGTQGFELIKGGAVVILCPWEEDALLCIAFAF